MAKGKSSSKKEKERKKKEEEKKQRELEAEQAEAEKNQEKLKYGTVFEDEARLHEVVEIKEQQTLATKEKLSLLAKVIEDIRCQRWNVAAWERYTSCDGRPSLEDPRELNAYISKWMDMKDDEPEKIFVQCDNATELLEEIEDMLQEARHQPLELLKECSQVKKNLEISIKQKIDLATLALLKTTSLATNPETGNSYYYGENNSMALAVWSNLSCNSRYNGTVSKELNVSFSIPRSVVITECAVRIMKTTNDYFSPCCNTYLPMEVPLFYTNDVSRVGETVQKPKTAEDITSYDDEGLVDLNEYFTVGSTISINLLSIPPQPCIIKQWVMTKVEEPDLLTSIPWISDYVPVSVSNGNGNDSKKEEEELEKEQQQAIEELKRLVFISIMLPDDALWLDVPKLARWNAVGNFWTTTGMHHIFFKEDNNTLTLYMDRFGTYALMQSRFGAFPYNSWELIPQSCNRRMLTITTMSFSVEIIVERLQAYGVYLTPKSCDYLYTTNIKQKDKFLENNIYRQMAMCSSSMAFSYSRWNATVGQDKFVVRVRHPDDIVDKIKQPVILITQTETVLLNITELSQSFSEHPSRDNQIAADLNHMVEALGSSSGRASLPTPDPVLVETIFQVLATCDILCC